MVKNLGIDFGTTNTIIFCKDKNGNFKSIGGDHIRTAIYFRTRDDFIIGDDALRAAQSPENSRALVINFKPGINEKYDIFPEDGEHFELKGQAIASLFLSRILTDKIESRFGKWFGEASLTDTDRTVITVPAKFDAERKGMIKLAATKAMYPNVRIAYEPTAAAFAALDSDFSDDVIAVYDFGGGTFDVSVIVKNNENHFICVTENGDPDLGGNKITSALIEKIVIKSIIEQGIKISMDPDDMDFDDGSMTEEEYAYNILNIQELVDCRNGLKDHFSESDDGYVETIKLLCNEEERILTIPIQKADFDNAIREHVKRTVDITRSVFEEASNKGRNVKKIIMAGGSSKLTLAECLLREEFETDEVDIIRSDDVFALIAKGALLMAEQQKLIHVEEKTASQFGLGVRTGIGKKKFELLIDVDQPTPCSGCEFFPVTDNQLKAGGIDVYCYDKDVRNYPNSEFEGDNGITFINKYHIAIDSDLNPSEVKVVFYIEEDGTLRLSTSLYAKDRNIIKEFDTNIMSDSDLE